VLPEVERLLAGHTTAGRWTLGQICNHLATAIRLTLDVPARLTEQTREQDITRRRFFQQGRFPEGMEAPIPVLLPRSDLDARSEAEALRGAIDRLVSASGLLPAHPRLGPLTKEEWVRFHCMHCAHHLGFAEPTVADETTGETG
jgi:hypothetical protein